MVDYDLTMPACRGADIQDMSIAELQENMRNGSFSATDLTTCYLERIKRVNTILKYQKSLTHTQPITAALTLDLGLSSR